MKTKIYFTVIGLLSAILGLTAQNEKTVSSKVTEATVFFRGAELTHTATVMLEKGTNEVRVEGLSAIVDINSLKIKTTNNVLVSSFDFSIDYLSKSITQSAAQLQNIEDSIKICKTELDKLNINIKTNNNMLKQLELGVSKSTSGSEKALSLEELIKTIDFYKTKTEQIENQQLTLNEKKINLEKTLQRLQAQFNQGNTINKERSGILRLTLVAPNSGNCSMTIAYFTTSAGWAPYSDITVTSTDKPILISQKSKVFQTTGLDWDKVKLTLSTATPSNGRIAPLFSTWFLREQTILLLRNQEVMMQNAYSYEKKSITSKDKVDMDLDELIVEALEEFEPETDYKNTMDDYIVESDNALNIVYTIDLPYSIPGNGKEQNIELQTKETKAEYKYYCAPKLDNATYVLAEISDWEKLGLLSGKANVTFEGNYIGTTYIDANSTHEKLSLTFGTDNRISVKREKMQDFSATKLLGNDIQQTFTYKITVKNNQNRKIKMVLKDQYPISTQKKVEVALLKETSRWTANKEDVGVITWEEDFEAGETKTYQISYSVKYPKEMKLNL
jgi:uncharacterized protein (TIGR02231 family)